MPEYITSRIGKSTIPVLSDRLQKIKDKKHKENLININVHDILQQGLWKVPHE